MIFGLILVSRRRSATIVGIAASGDNPPRRNGIRCRVKPSASIASAPLSTRVATCTSKPALRAARAIGSRLSKNAKSSLTTYSNRRGGAEVSKVIQFTSTYRSRKSPGWSVSRLLNLRFNEGTSHEFKIAHGKQPVGTVILFSRCHPGERRRSDWFRH